MRTAITVCLGLGLTVTACGNVDSSDNTGEPLIVLEGQTTALKGATATNPRAAFVWLLYEEQAEACLRDATSDEEAFFGCGFTAGKVASVSQSIAIESQFPATFKIPLHKLPDPEHLNGEDGAYLGHGVIVIYDDDNDNGELDLVPLEATESADTVLSSGHRDNVIVYREGALSPLWRPKSILGCAEPPEGFSIAQSDEKGEEVCLGALCVPPCVLREGNSPIKIQLGAETTEDREIVCPPGDLWTSGIKPPAEKPYREGITGLCGLKGFQLIVNPHPERYCTMANTVTYALKGTGWDVSRDIPSWWPCEVDIVEPGEQFPIEGTFKVVSHTLNTESCDAEGSAVSDPPYVKIAKDDFFSQLAGVDVMAVFDCSSPTACASQPSPKWGYLGWSDTAPPAWTGGSSMYNDSEAAKCSIEETAVVVERDDGGLRLERKGFSGTIDLVEKMVCDETLDPSTYGDAVSCNQYEVLNVEPL